MHLSLLSIKTNPNPPHSSSLHPYSSLCLSRATGTVLVIFTAIILVLSFAHFLYLQTHVGKRGKRMTSSGSFLRQLSGRESWKSTSTMWGGADDEYSSVSVGSGSGGAVGGGHMKQMEGFNSMYGGDNGSGVAMRKRVMVVVDQTSHSKHAMMWALTHVVNKGDLLTLLHVVPPSQRVGERASESSSPYSPYLANSLGSLCKACKPEVEVEALVIQGPKLVTVLSQVKKLEVSMLVLGQKKRSAFITCFCGTSGVEEFVEQCINNAECLTIGVRKQSRDVGGYLISTRWQKNFWLLA